MGIFSKIKGKVIGKPEEAGLEDIRSAILGEPQLSPVPPAPTYHAHPGPDERREFAPGPVPELPELPKMEEGAEEEFAPAYPTYPSPRGERTAARGEQVELFREIMDRLGIIEAQLAAVRSQTETINERIKGLEFKITAARKYGSYY